MNITMIAVSVCISSSLVAQAKGYAEEIGCADALYAAAGSEAVAVGRRINPSIDFTKPPIIEVPIPKSR